MDAEEKRRAALRGTAFGAGRALEDQMGLPERSLAEDGIRRVYGHEDDGRQVVRFSPHMRKFFDSMSEGDVSKLEKLMDLRPETVAWINGKNEKELKNLDGTVELISSSRTAGKVLAWVAGASLSFLVFVVTAAKNGWDLFTLFRGGR